MAIEKFDLGAGDTVVARSDCKHAVDILGGVTRPRYNRPADLAVLRNVASLLRQRGVSLEVQHTKGHAPASTVWRALNQWCDLSAKAESAARKADRLLNAPA
jgi:glyoxylase-like metal-dependent hydrolase (beta-lactamase superfamily II)